MDEAAIEKLDGKPLQAVLEPVKNAKTHEDVARSMARAAYSFGSSWFSVGVSDDARNPDYYTVYLSQGGLGLADRDFYVSERFKAQKNRYQQYAADMLKQAGWPDAEKHAADIVALETKIAEAHWSRAESRNRDKTYNPMTLGVKEGDSNYIKPEDRVRIW